MSASQQCLGLTTVEHPVDSSITNEQYFSLTPSYNETTSAQSLVNSGNQERQLDFVETTYQPDSLVPKENDKSLETHSLEELVIHNQSQDNFTLSHKKTTKVEYSNDFPNTKGDKHLAKKKALTEDVSGSPLVLVPDSDGEGQALAQPPLQQNISDQIELSCIDSAEVFIHTPRPRQPRPRPLRRRKLLTHMDRASQKQKEIRDTIPGSADEESDAPQDHVLPSLSLKSRLKRRKIGLSDEAIRKPHYPNQSFGLNTSMPSIRDPSDVISSFNNSSNLRHESIVPILNRPLNVQAAGNDGVSLALSPKLEQSPTDAATERSEDQIFTACAPINKMPINDVPETLTSSSAQDYSVARKAYPLRERTYQQVKPYTVDKRLHARLNLGREESVGHSTTHTQRKKNLDSVDHQDDEDDYDYEEDHENLIEPYEQEDSVIEESSQLVCLSTQSTHDTDQVGDISNDLLSMSLAGENSTTVGRRRLFQRRNRMENDEIGPKSESEKDEGMEEDEGFLRSTKKKNRASKYHVLPMSFFGKHALSDDIGTLKEVRREELNTSSSRGLDKAEKEVPKLAHHAKRRIISQGRDDRALGDFISKLALDNNQSESESDKNDDDTDRSSNESERAISAPGHSASPQPNGANRFGSYGPDHELSSSDDEALEVDITPFPGRRSYSGEKAYRKSNGVRSTIADFFRPSTKHRSANSNGSRDHDPLPIQKRKHQIHSPYTYADPHELNKERMPIIRSQSATSMFSRLKRKAMENSSSTLYPIIDPDDVQDQLFGIHLQQMHNSTYRRAHILQQLGPHLRYSQSIKRLRLMDPSIHNHLSDESGAESDSTLNGSQGAEYCKSTFKDLSSNSNIIDPNRNVDKISNVSYHSSTKRSPGAITVNQLSYKDSSAGPSRQYINIHSSKATTIPRQPSESFISSSFSSRHKSRKHIGTVHGQWPNTAPPLEIGIQGFKEWDTERKRIQRDKEKAIPRPPQYMTRPIFTLPPLPITPEPSRQTQTTTSNILSQDVETDVKVEHTDQEIANNDDSNHNPATEIELEELPPVREDIRAYMANSRKRDGELERKRKERRRKWDWLGDAAPVTGNPIRGGLHFSCATYIGSGTLSRILEATSKWRQDSYIPLDTLSTIVVHGQSFPPDWPDRAVMEYEMDGALFELLDQLGRIQDLSCQHTPEAAKESKCLQSNILQAMIGLTNVLINGLNHPILVGRLHIWKLFESHIIVPLQKVAVASQIQTSENALQQDDCVRGCEVDEACDSLLVDLCGADDSSFSEAIEMMRDVWKWGPGVDAVILLARHHQYRQCRDASTEGDYRIPNFLMRMIESANPDLALDHNIPRDDDIDPQIDYYNCAVLGGSPAIPRLPRLSVDISLVETVFPTDRTFEIFLKLAALTIYQQIELLSQSQQEDIGARPYVNEPRMDDPKLSQVETVALLSKWQIFSSCKRFVTKILCDPANLMAFDGAVWDPCASVCNSCNIVLVVALMTPDFVRSSRVVNMTILLTAKETNDSSRQIVFEALYHLGTIWQRQEVLGKLATSEYRHVELILEYYYTRLAELFTVMETEKQSPEISFRNYRNLATSYLTPAAHLAKRILELMGYLLQSNGRWMSGKTRYPKFEFLDKRLAPLFDPTKNFDSAVRAAAFQLVEIFFDQRSKHKIRLEQPLPEPAAEQKPLSITPTDIQVDKLMAPTLDGQKAISAVVDPDRQVVTTAIPTEDEDFSWLEDAVLDDTFTTCSLLEEPVPDLSKPQHSKLVPVVLEEDTKLTAMAKEWIFPALATLVTSRREILERQYIRNHSSSKAEEERSQELVVNYYPAPKNDAEKNSPSVQSEVNRNLQPARQGTATKQSQSVRVSIKLSPIALHYLRNIIADVSMILLDRTQLMMSEIEKLFKLGKYAPPSFRHWSLEDKLAWATRLAERNPNIFVEQELFFFTTWFETIGAPVNELSLQYQFSEVLVGHYLSVPGTPIDDTAVIAKMKLGGYMFAGVPWLAPRIQHRPPGSSQDGDDSQDLVAEIFEETNRLDEFRRLRYQILAKVLSNMGEQYSLLKPLLDRPYSRLHHVIQEVKTRYRIYLRALFESLEADYKRLEPKKSNDSVALHTEFICDIFGHATMTCQSIMQNDYFFQGAPTTFLADLRTKHMPSTQL
ncbi:hypothetical protein FBU30_007717 [Linnemannia zychae]|nr:hypothetical protein FBU30_007717 [Linnemannia zychae]